MDRVEIVPRNNRKFVAEVQDRKDNWALDGIDLRDLG